MNHFAQSSSSSRIFELELGVLRTVCSTCVDSSSLRSAFAQLAEYPWRNPDHRVVFVAALREFRDAGTVSLAGVAAQTTRAGFPDIDWKTYFTGENRIGGLLENRVAALLCDSR